MIQVFSQETSRMDSIHSTLKTGQSELIFDMVNVMILKSGGDMSDPYIMVETPMCVQYAPY